MVLTDKQELGLKTAVARYKAHEAYTCISGYAGFDYLSGQNRTIHLFKTP